MQRQKSAQQQYLLKKKQEAQIRKQINDARS